MFWLFSGTAAGYVYVDSAGGAGYYPYDYGQFLYVVCVGFFDSFCLVFEIPMVTYFLTMVGIITPDLLKKNRKYVLLVILILAALLTPPDIVSQLCLAAPMLLLYEIGIQILQFVYKRKLKKESKQANV